MKDLYFKLRRSISYRTTRSQWKKLAIEAAFGSLHKNYVILPEIGITLKKDQFIFLLKGYKLALQIVMSGGEFAIIDNKLTVDITGLTIEIQTTEELFIVKEIFINSCYEFHLDAICIVIDMGMNVGIASLYFANKENVRSVYSYEPFEPTFKQAKNNLKLNPSIAEKIIAYNIGLGDKQETIKVEYSPSNRGRVGVYGTSLVKNDIHDAEWAFLEILPATEAIGELLDNNQDSKIVVKMDVEGAEYEIIKNMNSNGLLSKIDVLMMEWHKTEPKEIIDSLNKNGFAVFKQNYSSQVGMIYAVK